LKLGEEGTVKKAETSFEEGIGVIKLNYVDNPNIFFKASFCLLHSTFFS
jgi:hypothetical protein